MEVDVNLARSLGIEPKREEILPVTATGQSEGRGYTSQDADSDYEEVRRNLKCVIAQSQEAIEGIMELAQDSQQPRAYEVVSQLIASNLEANTRLMDLHRRMKDLKRAEAGSKPNTVTNNSIYVGSTAELQKMLREHRRMIDSGEDPDAS